ncbi:MAG: hypothetical protein DWI24_06110 [Planctomycetota bacterium]|nr:MAG: hypothetical protein DWI24_06110 [Planctomycetota bacterium]
MVFSFDRKADRDSIFFDVSCSQTFDSFLKFRLGIQMIHNPERCEKSVFCQKNNKVIEIDH